MQSCNITIIDMLLPCIKGSWSQKKLFPTSITWNDLVIMAMSILMSTTMADTWYDINRPWPTVSIKKSSSTKSVLFGELIPKRDQKRVANVLPILKRDNDTVIHGILNKEKYKVCERNNLVQSEVSGEKWEHQKIFLISIESYLRSRFLRGKMFHSSRFCL